MADSVPNLDELLAHADWLRRLARCLATDHDDAEDLVQETLIAAVRSPPDTARPTRPWLAEVMRNVRRMAARGASRRRTREHRSRGEVEADIPGTDTLLERLELQRQLAAHVRELDEPYRTTVLLRFYEGRSAADIAAAQRVPAGTVRWRLREGLQRLRRQLDERPGGRAAWSALLAPAGDRAPGGLPTTGLSSSPAVLVIVGLVMVTTPALLWFWHRPSASQESAPPLAGRSPPEIAARPSIIPTNRTPNEKETEPMHPHATKTAALLGVVLPALVATAGEAGKPLQPAAAIDACVHFKERALLCKEQLADQFAAMAPPEHRAKYREKVLKEIVEEGSGPIEPRRAKCTKDVERKEKGHPPFGIFTDQDLAALKACDEANDCGARIGCAMKVMQAAKQRRQK